MAKKKVVVAFSGGLDTSYTVMKLAQEGWEVYAACANTGGFSDEQLKTNEQNAYKLGATKYVTLDVTHEYYEKSLKYMIFASSPPSSIATSVLGANSSREVDTAITSCVKGTSK